MLGDWDHPYLTLDPRYEAGILDVLADLLEGGFVFRQLKPIHWCMTDRTALAEAELEYHEETTPSIYVNFPMVSGVPACVARRTVKRSRWHAMIWTTTPWTLPANVAIAVHPDLTTPASATSTRRPGGPSARSWRPTWSPRSWPCGRSPTSPRSAAAAAGSSSTPSIAIRSSTGSSPIVLADYVSVEDGTGLVHTAPGHGAEDYQTGRAYQLSVLSPVDESGRFTAEAPDWLAGQQVFAANPGSSST